MIKHGSLVKRLRRRPLTAETRVRFPYELLRKYLVGYFLFLYLKTVTAPRKDGLIWKDTLICIHILLHQMEL